MAESETVQNQEDISPEQEDQEVVVEAAPDSELANPDANAKTIKIFCHTCQQKLDVTSLQPFARIACPSCGAELIIPKWFDTYLLEEPCGYGGMSSVYRALDIALDREVAIKILNPEIAPESERSALFLNEARTAATINHYSVIPIYTCGVFNEQTYIVMQFMNGGSLETKLNTAEGPLPIEEVARWIHDVADGLENACRHGIIHHDIKPGNIMLDADNNAKIGDFGIAQCILTSDETVSVAKETWVSPLYVSPEKVSTGEENSQGDIYSLGATFYHLLTGTPPFQSENLEELIWSRTKQNPLPPNQIRSDIPLVLTSLIMRMMHRYPDMRPNYQEIIASLETFLKNPVAAASQTVLKRSPLSRSAIYVPSGGTSGPASSIRPRSPSSILRRTSSSLQQPPPPRSAHLNPIQQNPPAPPQNPAIPQQQKPAAPVQAKLQPTVIQDPSYQWIRNKYLIAFLVLISILILVFVIFGLVQLLNAQDPKVLPDMPDAKNMPPAEATSAPLETPSGSGITAPAPTPAIPTPDKTSEPVDKKQATPSPEISSKPEPAADAIPAAPATSTPAEPASEPASVPETPEQTTLRPESSLSV